MEIDQNIALITGAGSGLGLATAKILAQKGAKLYLVDKDLSHIKDFITETNSFALECDITNETEIANFFSLLKERKEIPRICINCAGIIIGQRIVGKEGPLSIKDFKKVIDVNLIGTVNVLCQAAYLMSTTHFKQINEDSPNKEQGIIINTASIAAFEGQIGQAAYSASKAAVVGLTLPAARELSQFNIRVMTIAPGILETPMLSNMTDKLKANLLSQTIYPKRLGKAEEFAQLVVHIIENPLLNGSVIRLDGGIRLK